MATQPEAVPQPDTSAQQASVEMPRPTVAPMILSLGMVLLAAGLILGLTFVVVGIVTLLVGLGIWIVALLPGRGHFHETLVSPAQRRQAILGELDKVEQLRPGMPGYRVRLPERIHPISAGVKGGLLGGLVMPVPAVLWSLSTGHGLWYPVNLLAGMVLPGIGSMTDAQLEQFSPVLFLTGVVIHATMTVVIGLIYGVLLPTLPPLPSHVAWGGLLMPLLWTGLTFSIMQAVDPVLRQGVNWPWFIISQFLFGIVAAVVVVRVNELRPILAGLLGGAVGGLLMPLPAVFWSLLSGHGIWYPVNLLAGMIVPSMGGLSQNELSQFRPDWLIAGLVIHSFLSLGFGAVYGLLLTRMPAIPGSLAWGGLLFPLLWTGVSYSLMGVVNPLLQARVDWPWFILSQFVFGAVAAVVVDRSAKIPVPPAGGGPS
jgi:hypothetical protein